VFPTLSELGYDVECVQHADALLTHSFPQVQADFEEVLVPFRLRMSDLVGSGGGETHGTQALRRSFADLGWDKQNIQLDKTLIRFSGTVGRSTYNELDRRSVASLSHEIDHVKTFGDQTVLMEIEWNNKDPFFDRDLENFKRLHADGAASLGLIITRGASFQNDIREFVERYALRHNLDSIEALQAHGLEPTRRQRNDITNAAIRHGSFARGWAHAFCSDKYSSSTTNWEKLHDRLVRGVGNPCPLVCLGIPSAIIEED